MVSAFLEHGTIMLTANDKPVSLSPDQAIILAVELLKCYYEVIPEKV